jgi:DMSO/TMAO reductase YedYZ molybdopterin-dependent catalytic subunit
MSWKGTALWIRDSSLAALAGVAVQFALFYLLGWPLLTDQIAEWIMAHTPYNVALPIMETLGEWAKPWAATGGLAALGFLLFMARAAASRRLWTGLGLGVCGIAAVAFLTRYPDGRAISGFLVPALAVLAWTAKAPRALPAVTGRREFLLAAGVFAVAGEAWQRERVFARRAVEPRDLFPFPAPPGAEQFAPGLVRPLVTPVDKFYRMSKNPVDPVIDPREWKLKITLDGRPIRELGYAELLSLPRRERWITLRCVSNGISASLMGNAYWSGFFLSQVCNRADLPTTAVEVAFIGADGHDDTLSLDYAFSDELLFAVGMNGRTLNRAHGFPVRLLAPRYYGFKSVKWLSEIRFVSHPYSGYWQKTQNFTKEPVIHTMSHIDEVRREGGRLLLGGIAFAGTRGIRQVQVRPADGAWRDAKLEQVLSPYTWTRWKGDLLTPDAKIVEARALDGEGRWQAVKETPFFPDGVAGPTRKKLS